MQYLWSLGLLVLGLVLLVLFLVGAFRALRRTRRVQRGAADYFGGQVGRIKARVAGIRAEIAERRHRAAE